MRRRTIVAVVVALVLLAAGCGSDDNDTAETTAPAEVVAEDTATTLSQAPPATEIAETTSPSTTTPGSTDQEAEDEAAMLAFCAAFAGGARRADDVLALMSADAVVQDHTLATSYEGPEAIRAWIEEDPQLATYDVTTCDSVAVSQSGYGAGTYAFTSTSVESGSEGLGVVKVVDGDVTEFHAHYTPVATNPQPTAALAAKEQQLASDFCQAWGAGEPDAVVAMTGADFTLTTPLGEFVGADGVGQAMAVVEAQYDRVECSEDMVTNGGWIAVPSRFVNDETGEAWAGIAVISVADGVVTRQLADFQQLDGSGEPIAG